MAKEYFNAYHSYLKSIEPLNDAERGRLFTACLEYSITGTAPELRGNERFIFPMIQQQIDRDAKSYSEKCEKNRQNGSLGGQANATERQRTLPDAPQSPPKEKEKEKAKEKAKENTVDICASASSDFKKAFNDFREMRKKIRAPMTERAEKLIFSELDNLAGDNEQLRIDILNQSIERCWRGVFPIKSELKQKSKFLQSPANKQTSSDALKDIQRMKDYLTNLQED